jgi:hypothetical protein
MAARPLVHFSLAPFASISDNPALTHSGGISAYDFGSAAHVRPGAKHDVSARAYPEA